MKRSLLLGGLLLAVFAVYRMLSGRRNRNRYMNFMGMGKMLRNMDPSVIRESSRFLARTGVSMFRKMAR